MRKKMAGRACLCALFGIVFSSLGFVGRALPAVAATTRSGYWVATANGAVYPYGAASTLFGPASTIKGLRSPIVAIAATRDRNGYWMVAADGGVFAFGDARFYGSLGNRQLNAPIAGIAATPSGRGYWLVATDGGVFAFGDARFRGSGVDARPGPWVGIAPLWSVPGYVLVNATGSLLAITSPTVIPSPTRPIVGLHGRIVGIQTKGPGIWLVGSDGGVITYDGAGFYGSLGHVALTAPIVAMTLTRDGRGYWLAGTDGGVFAFGDATFAGSTAATPTNDRFVGIATS